ncbi:MAG: hypothetical protein OEW75_10560 [Cyclobacteriaceae bacterium]|nr:hypothetical protein [Cyclobacteriaceae bacterium]
MKRNDEDVDYFFQEIKKKDSKKNIPEFEDIYIKPIRFRGFLWAKLGVAASFLILAGFYLFNNLKDKNSEFVGIEIILSEEKTINTKSLINNDLAIDTWEPPTSSLIDDF